jgi:hypothetical protein
LTRRERSFTVRCADKGCDDTTFYLYTSQREYREIWERQQKDPWTCSRHREPDKVLRPDNPSTTVTLVASKVRNSRYDRDLADYEAAVARRSAYARKPDEFIPGLYWLPEGGGHGSGFTHGPGFKAHADDFPEGTRLTITATVEVPVMAEEAQ